MRIAFVTDGLFPDTIGGIQKYGSELILALAQAGAELDVYLQYPAPELQEQYSGFRNIRFRSVVWKSSGTLPGKYIRNLRRFSIAAFDMITNEGTAEVIYAQGFTGWVSGNEKWKATQHPIVFLNLHGLEMFQPTKGVKPKLIKWYFQRVINNMLHGNSRIIALGEKLKQILLEVNPTLQVSTIPNGIGRNWLKIVHKRSGSKCRFLFVGRNEWRKGVDTLNKALEKLLNASDQNWEMHFVGAIPASRQIISEKIFYHGVISDSTLIAEQYAMADVLLCPSYSEGMPTVILEAMAAGLAVIATDVGATAELVTPGNGVLIEAHNHLALWNAMTSMCSMDHTVLQKMGEYGRQRIEKEFTWDIVARKHLEIFAVALNEETNA